ncbi:MAG: AsnC family protein [Bacteroidales bacterium]|nr:AsnC family protein [Bacteroidales bacterium]
MQFIKQGFIPTQKEAVGINVGINSKLLLLVRQNNRISAKELAETLGISSRQCKRNKLLSSYEPLFHLYQRPTGNILPFRS